MVTGSAGISCHHVLQYITFYPYFIYDNSAILVIPTYMGNLIPCGKIYHSGLGKSKDRLEFPNSFRGSWTIDPIREISGIAVYTLRLHLTVPAAAAPYHRWHQSSDHIRPRCRDAGDLFCRIDIHIISIKIPQDLDGTVPRFSELTAAPLRYPP